MFFDELSDFSNFFITAIDQVIDLEAFELSDVLDDPFLDAVCHEFGMAMGASEGFLDNAINHAMFEVVFGGEFEGLGSFVC